MPKPRKSTTPKADAIANVHRELYEKHEKVSCTMDQWRRAKCKCGCRLDFGISAYAYHRGPEEVLMVSQCGRVIWFNRTDYAIMKEGEKTV